MKKASKPPLLMTHFIFEFRGTPLLITVIYMDPHSPNKLIATEYCFLILRDDYRFLFLYFRLFFVFFVILCYFVIINFYKNYFIIILLCYYFFMKIIFTFSCSGMFRFPGFTDAHFKIENESHPDYHELPSAKQMLPLK